MYKFGDCDGSIYELISKLCIAIVGNGDDSDNDMRKCRAKAFEVLLKEYPLNQTKLDSNDYFEFRSELQRQLFTTRLGLRCSENMERRYQALLKCKELVDVEQQIFDTLLGTGCLYLLLKLSELDEDIVINKNFHDMLTPTPLMLVTHAQNNQCQMDHRKLQCIVRPCPKYFKGVDRMQAFEPINVKMFSPTFPRMFQIPSSSSIETFETTRIQGRFSGLMPNRYAHVSYKKERVSTFRFVLKKPKVLIKHAQPKSKAANSRRMRSFVTDVNASYELMSLYAAQKGEVFKPLVMSVETFIRDLKSLAVGTLSETFYLDEDDAFQMLDNVSVEGVLPDEIRQYVEPFLNCGTCFRHLNHMCDGVNLEQRQDGFLYKTMCNAVTQYLIAFRQFVFAQNQLNLALLYKNMRSMMKLLVELTMTLQCDLTGDQLEYARRTHFFLYIWQQIQECTKNDFITLLTFILKQMCDVYYKRLQKWAMHGILDDPCEELFISFVDFYPEKTKYFFDRAYLTKFAFIPEFLRSYEYTILDCGKYTMLLKNFSPNHPLFNLKCPEVRLCFNDRDLQTLTDECKAYLLSARAFSKPICMSDIYAARQLKKEKSKAYIQQIRQKQIELWQMQQRMARQESWEKKRQVFEDFKQQNEEQLQRMRDQRADKIVEELICHQKCEKFETEALTNENFNLRKRIEYFEFRSDLLRDEISDADRKIDRKTKLQEAPILPSETESPNAIKCNETDLLNSNGDDETRTAFGQHDVTRVKLKDLESTELEEQLTKVKRSSSDILNSNDTQITKQPSEFEQNRQRVLGSTVFADAINMHVELNDNDLNAKTATNATANPLTDAECNKLRVMTSHTGVILPTTMTADVNLNVLMNEKKNISELERNRNQMMHTDMFEEFNKPEDVHIERARRHLRLDSELARNRHRVLSSEYDIAVNIETAKPHRDEDANCGSEFVRNRRRVLGSDFDNITPIKPVKQHTKETATDAVGGASLELNLDLAELQSIVANPEINTPMSTTSDISVGTVFEECQTKAAALDACNNNNSNSIENDSMSDYLDALSELNSPKKLDKIDTKKQDDERLNDTSSCDNDNGIFQTSSDDYDDDDNALLTFNKLFQTMDKVPRSPKFISSLRGDTKVNLKPAYVNHHSTDTLKRFLLNSIMRPVQSHFYLVRNEVMRVFFEDLCIYEHFRSLRNYFFLMDGEFGELLTEGIIGQLESGKPLQKILNYQSLHDVLNRAIASSVSGATKHSENLSFTVKDMREEVKLTSPDALNGLSLCYTVEWPLNLVFNSDACDRYKMIFQYLFKLRRVSYALEQAYQFLRVPQRQPNNRVLLISPQYRHVQMMRHKFAHFVNTLQNYLAASVLQSSWMKLKDALCSVDSVESLYKTHVQYLKRITFLCFLNRKSAKMCEAINAIFTISLRFCKVLTSEQFLYDQFKKEFVHDRYHRLVFEERQFEEFLSYTIYLGKKIVRHGYQEEIRHFIELVNINGYYSEHFETPNYTPEITNS